MITGELPGMIRNLKEDIITEIDTRVAAAIAAIPTVNGPERPVGRREISFKDFSACHPPTFHGGKDPVVSRRWIADLESAFYTSYCQDGAKARFASFLLRDGGRDWWEIVKESLSEEERDAITWTEFVERYTADFEPRVEMERVGHEYLALEQTTELVREITDRFRELTLLCPEVAGSERMKMSRYVGMLRTDIREFVRGARCESLVAMYEVAREREIELETQARKRKISQVSTGSTHTQTRGSSSHTAKKSRSSDIRSSGKKTQETPRHPSACYKCGQQGHYARDCKMDLRICYHCQQVGHVKTNCPALSGGGEQAQVPAALRITEGRQGKAAAQKAKTVAYQMTAGEAVEAPRVITGTYDFRPSF